MCVYHCIANEQNAIKSLSNFSRSYAPLSPALFYKPQFTSRFIIETPNCTTPLRAYHARHSKITVLLKGYSSDELPNYVYIYIIYTHHDLSASAPPIMHSHFCGSACAPGCRSPTPCVYIRVSYVLTLRVSITFNGLRTNAVVLLKGC